MSRLDARSQLAKTARWKQRMGWIAGSILVLAACVAIRSIAGPESAAAKQPAATKEAKKTVPDQTEQGEPKKLQVVAVVNGEEITREELAKECLAHYGKEMLEGLVNKHLISEECRRKQIVVTDQEIHEEIDRVARKVSLPKDQFLAMLDKERGIKPQQYAKDIVWPTLALRKLAAPKLRVTKEELEKGYESQFGRAVKARMIAITEEKKASKVHAQAKAKPANFARLAKEHSEDVNSASAGGLIPPIRKHLGNPDLEKAAFALQEGEVSPLVKVGDQWVFLKCEGWMEASEPDRNAVDPLLTDAIRDRKLRSTASDLFRELQERSKIQNIYNDPQASKQMPGVAAIINDRKITVRELAEECIDRHGIDVLEGTINRHLLEHALKKRKLKVEQADLDAEIARAAVAMGQTNRKGEADAEGWIKRVTKEQGISADLYVHDAVWPTVALKKIVGDHIEISNEELKRGFEANYGRRVRCRAIICNNQRKAQEVWNKARDNPSAENFAKLAKSYSIDANSASMGGEVPPIRQHGGQPILEREAFKLETGELSGIIQVGDSFIVLLCEGFTDPEKIEFKEVKKYIYDDLHEKKQRLEMAKIYDELKESAQIDNFLAGKIQVAKKSRNSPAEKAAVRPASALRK